MATAHHLSDFDVGDAPKIIELDWYADGETVSINPRDQQRFEIQKDRAISILRREKDREDFVKQFRLLLNLLAGWIRKRSDKINGAYSTLRDGRVLFVVVRSQVRYDEDFEDELTGLDFLIANDRDLELVPFRAMALPLVEGEALLSFLDSRLVLAYGKRTLAHTPSES